MDELIKRAEKTAVEYFNQGYFCSEAITLTLEKECGIKIPDEVKRGMSAFVEGVGGAGCICGALNGSIFLLSMMGGRISSEEDTTRLQKAARELHDDFKKEFTSTCCRVITKKASTLFGIGKFSKCPTMVAFSIRQLILKLSEYDWFTPEN